MPYPLKKLGEMELISKSVALNDKTKKTFYYTVSDNLTAFYYGLVYPNLAARQIMDPSSFFKCFIEKKMNDSFVPKCFEKIALEYLIRENKKGKIVPPFTGLGPLTYNDSKKHITGRLGLVGEDEEGRTVNECRFTNEKIGEAVVEEERRRLIGIGVQYKALGFFSKNGYKDKNPSDDLFLCTLEDIYK